MLSAVVDTNVFVSGLLKGKVTRAIVNALIDNKFRLIISVDLFNELIITANKPRLAPFIDEFDKTILTSLIKDRFPLINPSERVDICRDPEDNKVLEAAVAGNADSIVTGDKDLLALKSIKNTSIITPKEFIQKLKSR